MNALRKLIRQLPNEIRLLLALIALAILMSLSGCKSPTPRVVVIPADQTETFLTAGQTVTASNDCVLMGLERYRRYRRAVADKILEMNSNHQDTKSPSK